MAYQVWDVSKLVFLDFSVDSSYNEYMYFCTFDLFTYFIFVIDATCCIHN